MTEIKDKILATIKVGEVKMRPRWHFILKALLVALLAVFVALALIFFVSLVGFIVSASGAGLAPGAGLLGWRLLLTSLPWALVLAAIALVLILEVLVSRYSFAYRQPLLYSIIGVVLLTILGGWLVAQTPLHRGIYREFRGGRLPAAGPIYGRFNPERLENAYIGSIKQLTEGGFILETETGEELTIIVSVSTRGPIVDALQPGLEVAVFGLENDNRVEAFGIRPLEWELKAPGQLRPNRPSNPDFSEINP